VTRNGVFSDLPGRNKSVKRSKWKI